MNAALIGAVIMVSKIFDGFSDLIAGQLIDDHAALTVDQTVLGTVQDKGGCGSDCRFRRLIGRSYGDVCGYDP